MKFLRLKWEKLHFPLNLWISAKNLDRCKSTELDGIGSQLVIHYYTLRNKCLTIEPRKNNIFCLTNFKLSTCLYLCSNLSKWFWYSSFIKIKTIIPSCSSCICFSSRTTRNSHWIYSGQWFQITKLIPKKKIKALLKVLIWRLEKLQN